jgi:hypothetical protein
LRNIIKLLNQFLKDVGIKEQVEYSGRYLSLYKSSLGCPLKNLLFDFCLSALVGDTFDAKYSLNIHYISLDYEDN